MQLARTLFDLQLYAADQFFQKAQAVGELSTFSDMLLERTAVFESIQGYLRPPNVPEDQVEPSQYLEWVRAALAPTLERMEAIYAAGGDGWQEAVWELMEAERAKLKALFPSEGTQKEKETIGVFQIDEPRAGLPGLEARGIQPKDEYLELHVAEFFKVDAEHFGAKGIRDALGTIAERIVDQFPQTRAVTGISWLMDRPIARRLGFTVLDELQAQRGMGLWSQFIDKNGQIDRGRLQKFLDTGEVPFKRKFGFILVEDFLQKYLPAERRGKEITLREVDPVWYEWRKRLDADTKALRDRWSKIEPGTVRVAFEELPTWKEACGRLGILDSLVAYLEIAKSVGRSWDEVRSSPDADLFVEKLKELDDGKYREQRIIIL